MQASHSAPDAVGGARVCYLIFIKPQPRQDHLHVEMITWHLPDVTLPKHTQPAKRADITLTQSRQVTKPDLVTLPCARDTSSHPDPFSGPGRPFQGPHGLYPTRIRFWYISPLQSKTADALAFVTWDLILSLISRFPWLWACALPSSSTLLLLYERTRLFSLIWFSLIHLREGLSSPWRPLALTDPAQFWDLTCHGTSWPPAPSAFSAILQHQVAVKCEVGVLQEAQSSWSSARRPRGDALGHGVRGEEVCHTVHPRQPSKGSSTLTGTEPEASGLQICLYWLLDPLFHMATHCPSQRLVVSWPALVGWLSWHSLWRYEWLTSNLTS